MRLAYPAELTEEPEGGFTVTFPDVPEGITHGRDREEALREAEATLASALSFYADEGQAFPRRSPAAGRPLVHVSSLAAAKLALRDALAKAGVSQSELARRMASDPKAIRRLVDLGHRSHIGEVERALRVLNRRLVVVGSVRRAHAA
ncbi:MAG TPA: type II toxin-antitoxin system HicB family antitoxin [Geminicoccaceae bacterium]|jgi:antitoxin HicB|nr:type II toxin-antitoxin system HicB family antitoxin [Geminicoccaceae bacterium]